MKTGCVYLVTNLVNGKQYVGQTIGLLEKRWKRHTNSALAGSSFALHRAIRKHGAAAFEVRSVHVCTEALLAMFERHFIKTFKTLGQFGYNMTAGGEGILSPTKVIRRKISEAAKARYAQDPGLAVRIANSNKGQKRSAETVAKLVSAWELRRKRNPEGTWLGKIHTPSSKQKMSEAAKRRWSVQAERIKAAAKMKDWVAANGAYWQGRTHTLDARRKMSEAALQRQVACVR